MSPSCVGGKDALQYHTQPWLTLKRKRKSAKHKPKLKRYVVFPESELKAVPEPASYKPQHRADQPKTIKVKS